MRKRKVVHIIVDFKIEEINDFFPAIDLGWSKNLSMFCELSLDINLGDLQLSATEII